MKQTQKNKKMPGPYKKGLLGDLTDYARDPIEFLIDNEKKYGDIFHYRLLHISSILITNPEYARHILHNNSKNYHKSKQYEEIKLLLGKGVITTEKKEWTWRRNMSMHAFQKKSLEGYIPPMQEAVREIALKWEKKYTDGRQFDVFNEMNALALDVAGRTLFGMSFTGIAPYASDLISEAAAMIEDRISGLTFPMWLPFPKNIKFGTKRKKLHQLTNQIIDDGRKDYEKGVRRGNLLEVFFENEREGAKAGWNILDEAVTYLIAGHETTGSAMTWTWYLLAKYPEAAAKVKKELKKVLRGRIPELEDLPRLKYTNQFILESMRLYPPIWLIGRRAIQDDEIGGYPVKAGDNVLISMMVSHRSERYWNDPLKFDPERFSPENKKKIDPYVYMPFSNGPRTCIGNNFAMQEILITIGYLAQKFSPEIAPGFEPKAVAKVAMRPRGGMMMHL